MPLTFDAPQKTGLLYTCEACLERVVPPTTPTRITTWQVLMTPPLFILTQNIYVCTVVTELTTKPRLCRRMGVSLHRIAVPYTKHHSGLGWIIIHIWALIGI